MSLRKKAVKIAAGKAHPALLAAIWVGAKTYKIYKKKKEKKDAKAS